MTRVSALSLGMSSTDNAIAAKPVTATARRRAGTRALPPGLALGTLGIVGFSFSLPATRLAVADLDPWVVAFGRATVAAALAAIYLLATGAPRPTREQARSLAIVAAGVVVGFPLLTSLALEVQTAAHGAVVIAILPAATAVAAVQRAHEHPTRAFWLAAAAGFVYLSVLVHSRTLLVVATLAILAYTGWFTGEHFADSIGWPLALIAFGIFMIGLSALAFRIDRDYVRKSG